MTDKQMLKLFKKVYNRLKRGQGENWHCGGGFGDGVQLCVLGHFKEIPEAVLHDDSGWRPLDVIWSMLDGAGHSLYEDYIPNVNDEIGLDAVLSCLEHCIDQLEARC